MMNVKMNGVDFQIGCSIEFEWEGFDSKFLRIEPFYLFLLQQFWILQNTAHRSLLSSLCETKF